MKPLRYTHALAAERLCRAVEVAALMTAMNASLVNGWQPGLFDGHQQVVSFDYNAEEERRRKMREESESERAPVARKGDR